MSNGTYGSWETDKELEKTGVWIDQGISGKFKLARAGGNNQAYKQLLRNLVRPYQRQINAGTMDPDVADRLTIEAFSKTVVLDWKDVTGKDKMPLKFSVENAAQLLTDLPDLFTELRAAAETAAAYRRSEVEEQGKS